MRTLSRKWTATHPPRSSPEPRTCVYRGAVAGLLIALAAFLVGSTYYVGYAGLCDGNCATLGSFLTIVLSQPIALAGIIIGAAVGGGYAFATCRRRTGKDES